VYTYNYLGIEQYTVASNTALPEGKSSVKLDFAYDGGAKPGAGGTATLYVDGNTVGSTRIEKTQFAIFSADETAGVGIDPETSVADAYDSSNHAFTGTIDKVVISVK
jgi:arylsulfatase